MTKSSPQKKASRPAKEAKAQSIEQAIARAWQSLSDGLPKQADSLCALVLKQYPEHAHAWFIRGLAAATSGKHAVALKHFERVQASPDLLPSLEQAKGRSHLSLAQFDIALAHLQQALLYKPDDAQSHYLLGVTERQLGNLEGARRFFRHAAMLEPTLGAAHFELGALALQSGDAQKAVGHFNSAATHLPLAPEVHNNLGLSYQGLGLLDDADASFRRSIDLLPSYAEAWFNLGLLLRHRGSSEAVAAIDRALALNPALKQVLPDGS